MGKGAEESHEETNTRKDKADRKSRYGCDSYSQSILVSCFDCADRVPQQEELRSKLCSSHPEGGPHPLFGIPER